MFPKIWNDCERLCGKMGWLAAAFLICLSIYLGDLECNDGYFSMRVKILLAVSFAPLVLLKILTGTSTVTATLSFFYILLFVDGLDLTF